MEWNIGIEGRSWSADELPERLELLPEKREVIAGKLFWSDEERLALLAMLLENVGTGAAVRLGDAEAWRRAVATL
jgi:hypothetical protein